MQKIIVTYHKDCIDGTTAAAIVLRKFPDALSFPLAHAHTESDMAEVVKHATEGAHLITVDCTMGAREFLAHGCTVTTIDHHIGGKEESEALARGNKDYTYVFNNDKSGASLAWDYFFPEEALPEMIMLVEDSDLWRWKYGDDTKDVNNYLSMFWNDPAAMLEILQGDLAEVKAKGRVISNYVDREIEQQLTLPSLDITIGTHTVPAFNITTYASATGNFLSKKLDKAVGMYVIKGSEVRIRFRSKEHQVPSALDLASALGGGGHQCSAGATISLKQFISMIKQ